MGHAVRHGFGLLALAACLFGPGILCAQQYGFTQFTPRDGLAQSQVRCMAQDKAGYLWIGTLGGASRFDGLDFTNYGLRNGLPDPQVNALLAAADGTVWLGCGPSLVHFDGRAMHSVPLPAANAENKVLALAEGADGAIYAATDGTGLLQVREGRAATTAGWPADTAQQVRALLALPDGSLLVGLRNGLLRGKAGAWGRVALPMAASISSLALGPDGTVWAGTYGDGLLEIPVRGAVVVHAENEGLLQGTVRSVLVDKRGRVWAATKFGINLLEGGRMRAFTVHQGMPNDNVWALFQDADGGIWAGTDGAGLLRYNGDAYVTWTVTEGLCSDLVMAGVADQRGDIWLGTYGNGVCRMDGMAHISTLDGLPNNTVWCALADPDGSLWFGTSDGLCRILNGVVVPLSPPQPMAGQRVLCLYRHPDGNLWCGTRDGLAILHPDGTVEQQAGVQGIKLRGVRSIRQGADGGTWLATDLGVVHISGGKARHFTTRDGLASNTVFCLALDAKERLWIGTSDGLSCIAGEKVARIDLGTDFGSNYAGSLLRDSSGKLWAGTNNGLFRFDPDSLLANPSARDHITEEDGLRGLEFNLNAAFMDGRGKLFFGTNAGLVQHDPGQADGYGGQGPPVARITGITNAMEPIAGSDSIGAAMVRPLKVGFRRNHLTFTYTAIALANGRHVRFQYRLAGFDKDWLPATAARFASYSNLPHGDYTFEVRAADRPGPEDGRWGPVAAVRFTITPPFWMRGWFFALCAAAVLAALLGIARFRAARRQRQEKTRGLILRSRMLQLEQQALNANMNRHFIFNALNSIQYSINRQDRAMANKYLTSFAKLIRKNLDASQSDTTTLAEELERLELYLVLEHMRFKDKFQYTITVAPGVDPHAVHIPAMMLQPYVENSIWHGILPMAHAGHVDIAVDRPAPGRTRIRITDNGVGIDNSMGGKAGRPADHISRGIEITKGRADILRKLQLGDIRIQGPEPYRDGQHNTGTRVTVELTGAPPAEFAK